MYEAWLNKPCGCVHRVPPLIIMDLGMPIMDGKEASKLILAMLKKAKTPDLTKIVALTSFTNKKTVDECLAIGMKEVFFKPLTAAHLAQMLL